MSRGFPVKPRTRSKKRYKPEINSYPQIQFTGHRTSNTAEQVILCTIPQFRLYYVQYSSTGNIMYNTAVQVILCTIQQYRARNLKEYR